MAEKEIYPVRFNEVTNLIAHMLGEDYDTVAQWYIIQTLAKQSI